MIKKFTTLAMLALLLPVAAIAQSLTPTPRPSVTPTGTPPSTAKPASTVPLASPSAQSPPPTTAAILKITPMPVLYLLGQEYYTANGKNWIRYKYDVFNKEAYPAAMFAPAPTLPPCGNNTNSSRTWVDFFDSTGKRLYGFCALGKPADMGGLWFAMEDGIIPPSYVYIEMNDRQTNTKYKSNLADTTL